MSRSLIVALNPLVHPPMIVISCLTAEAPWGSLETQRTSKRWWDRHSVHLLHQNIPNWNGLEVFQAKRGTTQQSSNSHDAASAWLQQPMEVWRHFHCMDVQIQSACLWKLRKGFECPKMLALVVKQHPAKVVCCLWTTEEWRGKFGRLQPTSRETPRCAIADLSYRYR